MSAVEWGDVRLPERFWRHVYPEPNTGCWLWGAGLTTSDYGTSRVVIDGSGRLAHRAAHFALVGSVPHPLELDHTCRVRWCVNVAHLEVVTSAENRRRGIGPARTAAANAARARRRTHFKCGHSIVDHAKERSDGRRQCGTCNRHHRKVRVTA